MRIWLLLVLILVVCDAAKNRGNGFTRPDEPRLGCRCQRCNDLRKKIGVKITPCKKEDCKLPELAPPPHNPVDPCCQCQECFLFNEEERGSIWRKLGDCLGACCGAVANFVEGGARDDFKDLANQYMAP